mmetsp:Transcript_38988/g.107562  ORF Transcript_38988/g.107562 Transcript_38988/m.107562 type:complete len:154 (+) Transcript_38988:3-464(+)
MSAHALTRPPHAVTTRWSGKARGSHIALQEADEAVEAEAEAAPQWVQGNLASGEPFWWWFESDEDENDGDIELEQPPTAWRIGELADGRAYTWRDSEDGDDDPEIKIWKEGELGSGDAYWFADDGMVSMTDPFDLTVVQRWIPGDGVPDDEDE